MTVRRPITATAWATLWSVCVTLFMTACGDTAPPAEPSLTAPPADDTAPALVTDDRLRQADKERANWLSHGRTYNEQRFSPLNAINEETVGELGLAWSFDTGSHRGLEATPIVVDGMMYSTGTWSVVYAHDAKTGELRWTYDPRVPRAWGYNACCDVVNRGVAAWGGNVYLGTIDGRLVALDAGERRCGLGSAHDRQGAPYTITGAPRVVNGKVVIGNGGAELGVRGYVTAYDAATGEQAWRFFTVPGDPANRSSIRSSKRRRRHGAAASGGRSAAAARPGTLWPTTPSSICCTSVWATARRGAATHAAQEAATICTCLDHRPRRRHRPPRLALPDHARRQLGLHRGAADDPGGHRDRRRPRAR